MKDKPGTLDDIRRKGREQENSSRQLKEQSEAHKKRVETLDESLKLLAQSNESLDSSFGKDAIESIKREKESSNRELQRFKEEHEELKRENADLQKRLEAKRDNNRKVRKLLEVDKKLIHSADGLRNKKSTDESLEKEWNEIQHADVALSTARYKLNQLKIE